MDILRFPELEQHKSVVTVLNNRRPDTIAVCRNALIEYFDNLLRRTAGLEFIQSGNVHFRIFGTRLCQKGGGIGFEYLRLVFF